MTAYKDEKRGTWFVNSRYRDWRGEPQRKARRGFRTRRDALRWERDFKEKMGEIRQGLGEAMEASEKSKTALLSILEELGYGI